MGTGGEAINYPRELDVGEEASVTVVVVNREHEPVTYRIEVVLDGTRQKSVGPFTLAHEEKWQEAVSFSAEERGDPEKAYARKLEFILYKSTDNEPYLQPLFLWITVQD